ncbi:MAG: D-aminoacyl-tRNA deacylase [Chloroflexi bacterium]|nr:D-aminoacyl-tRNA deacylase [Chloroflexota bacterium]
MRAVIQRVTESVVTVDGKVLGRIDDGLLILLGVGADDEKADADYMAEKIANLRIFRDEEGKMNLSLIDTGGKALIISQFTIYGDCRKGRRPGFTDAAPPDKGKSLYEYFIEKMKDLGVVTGQGEFGAMMKVSLVNDGPVTFILDSKRLF